MSSLVCMLLEKLKVQQRVTRFSHFLKLIFMFTYSMLFYNNLGYMIKPR